MMSIIEQYLKVEPMRKHIQIRFTYPDQGIHDLVFDRVTMVLSALR